MAIEATSSSKRQQAAHVLILANVPALNLLAEAAFRRRALGGGAALAPESPVSVYGSAASVSGAA
ncbi:MAG: hypothetical protein MZV49_24895 [Rhodopseudomonas palustris]|nr:hypothetical protein [Rhodopseudomonas palustris]